MARAHGTTVVLLIGLLALGACGRESGSSDQGGSPGPTTALAEVGGVVVDDGGRPVEGALVQPRSIDDPPLAVPELAVMSGPDGRFEWRLAAGHYEFSAVKEDRKGVPLEVAAAVGQVEEVELRLP